MLTIPALKIQQFDQEFYLLNLAAADIDRLVRFEVLGQSGVHGKKGSRRKKSAGLINWGSIEQKVQTSEKAYQRPIMRKKVEELAKYYLQCRDEQGLPAIPGAVILTCDEQIEFSSQDGNPFLGMVELPETEGVLRVLDGQHRLLALAALLRDDSFEEHDRDMARMVQVPAILFAGLPPQNTIEMFVTINAKHTRLNPSLLLTLSGRKLYGNERDALIHDVLRKLNEASGSPLEKHIKLLGVGRGKVQQSGLAREMRDMFDRLEKERADLLAELLPNAAQFFKAYFRVISKVFGSAWSSRKHSTRSAIALRAFIMVVPEVLVRAQATQLKVRPALERVLAPWGDEIGPDRFETSGDWREKLAGGSRQSTRALARELREALGEPT